MAFTATRGPVFIRLGRKPSNQICEDDCEIVIRSAVVLREGYDASIVPCGRIVGQAPGAAEILAGQEQGVRVLNLHMLKPPDNATLLKVAWKTSATFDG